MCRLTNYKGSIELHGFFNVVLEKSFIIIFLVGKKNNSLVTCQKEGTKIFRLGVRFYDADPAWQVHYIIYV